MFTHFKSRFVGPLLIMLVITPFPAKAVFIDFDDLNPVYDEEWPCWCDNPLSDEYLDKGLLINGAWVNGADHENVMLTSNWASLEFVGSLPLFVSMNVTSHYGDAIFLNVYGASGFLFSVFTSGWQGWEELSTPVIPGELVSLTATEGIKYITIQGFYGMRIGASIDNLNFTYASAPEPSPLLLAIAGLALILWRRRIITATK